MRGLPPDCTSAYPGSTKRTECDTVMAHSVPNDARSKCECDRGYFDYDPRFNRLGHADRENFTEGDDHRQKRAQSGDGEGAELSETGSPSSCIKCPTDGALCAQSGSPQFRDGLIYSQMEITEGWWQDPSFLAGKSHDTMANMIRFEWCGFRSALLVETPGG